MHRPLFLVALFAVALISTGLVPANSKADCALSCSAICNGDGTVSLDWRNISCQQGCQATTMTISRGCSLNGPWTVIYSAIDPYSPPQVDLHPVNPCTSQHHYYYRFDLKWTCGGQGGDTYCCSDCVCN